MAHVTYKIVPHDGGWTYTQGGVFAETFRTREAAAAAARTVAAEQRTPGDTEAILFETADGCLIELDAGHLPADVGDAVPVRALFGRALSPRNRTAGIRMRKRLRSRADIPAMAEIAKRHLPPAIFAARGPSTFVPGLDATSTMRSPS